MSVKININSVFQELTNDREVVEVDGKTVKECLDRLTDRFPALKSKLFKKNGELLAYIDIFVNQENCLHEELAKTVDEGDEMYIMPIYGGG